MGIDASHIGRHRTESFQELAEERQQRGEGLAGLVAPHVAGEQLIVHEARREVFGVLLDLVHRQAHRADAAHDQYCWYEDGSACRR